MKDNKNLNDENNEENAGQSAGKVRFYIGIAAMALGAIAFGLSFTVLGVYSLIAAELFEIAAVSFLNSQKMKNDFPAVKYVRIGAYAALVLVTLFFIGGVIWSAV